jgi:hypothetical protein
VLNRFGEGWPGIRRKPETDMNFRRSLPEIRCLLGWAFGPRKLMKNCHADFVATHERPQD